MYAASSAHRASEFTPARSADQRMKQPNRNASAYTSVSVALSQSVDIRPAVSPAAIPSNPSSVHFAKRLVRMPQPKAGATPLSKLISPANPKTEPQTIPPPFPPSTKTGGPAG